MAHKFFEDRRPHNGIDYFDFIENTKAFLESENAELLDKKELNMFNYKKMNVQRSYRISKTFKIDDEIKSLIARINKPQLWMVVTEDWCGDSAQNIPYLFMISELSDLITFKIVTRDDNLDIIDLYLTNGTSRSIPILVSFDEDGSELFQWGPRPKYAQDQIEIWKSEGKERIELTNLLHLWYAKNKGQNLLKEIKTLITESIDKTILETVI